METERPEPGAMGDDPVHVGIRVALRYRLPAGAEASFTDVVGVVTAVDASQVTVDSRRGAVTVARSDVVAVRAVPPGPSRPGRAHRVAAVRDLERVMAQGWVAVDRAELGAWQLRASSGFTRRANSVLPLGDPGLPVEKAVELAERWYAGRDLPTLFHLDLPAGGGDVEDDPLGSLLLRRGYAVEAPSVVMTGAALDIGPPPAQSAPVSADGELTVAWLHAYGHQRSVLPGVTEQVLTGSAGQLFLSSTDDAGTIRGLVRMSVHPGWAGIHALWVDPDHRGRGRGRDLVRAVAALAVRHRMPSVYLQVLAENAPAQRLFASLGLAEHHAYAYVAHRPG